MASRTAAEDVRAAATLISVDEMAQPATEFDGLRLVLPRQRHIGPALSGAALAAVHGELLGMARALLDVCVSEGGGELGIGAAAYRPELGEPGVAVAAANRANLPQGTATRSITFPQGLRECMAPVKYFPPGVAQAQPHWEPLPQTLPNRRDLPLPAPQPEITADDGDTSDWDLALANRGDGPEHVQLLLQAGGFTAARLRWSRLLPPRGQAEAPHMPPTDDALLAAREAWLASPAGAAVAARHGGVDLRRLVCVLSSFEQEVLLDMLDCVRRVEGQGST